MSTEQRRWILCGGLASGKSTARRLLEDAGIATIDADSIGHQVLEPNGAAFSDVAERWPEVVVDGRISRPALAAIVFNDRDQLSALEAITHPHIFEEIGRRSAGLQRIVVEMPVIRDSEGDWNSVVVDCRDELKLERAVERGMDPGDARSRLESQPSRASWLAIADVVLPNHRGLQDLREAVAKLVPFL